MPYPSWIGGDVGTPRIFYVGGPGSNDNNTGLVWSNAFATVTAAVNAINAGYGSGLIVMSPYYTSNESGSIDIDCSKIQLRGFRSTVSWGAIPAAGYCIKFYRNGLVDSVTSDGIWYGSSSGKQTGVCIQVGDGVNMTSDLAIRNGNVSNFTAGVSFTSNTYRITFDRFDLITSGVETNNVTTNFGEGMVWKDSLLEAVDESTPLHFGRGGWNFQHCKFDEAPILADTQYANLQFDQCHMENPTLGNYTYLTVSNGAKAHLNSGRVVIDQPAGGYTATLFNSDASNTGYGGSGIFIHEPVELIYYGGYTGSASGLSTLIGGTGPGYWVDSQFIPIGNANTPAFQNAWVNVGGSFALAGYKMSENGIIRYRGAVQSGTAGLQAFQVPPRYRSKYQLGIPTFNTSTFAANSVQVTAAGGVVPMYAQPTDLDGVWHYGNVS